jgi:hypothetical protein
MVNAFRHRVPASSEYLRVRTGGPRISCGVSQVQSDEANFSHIPSLKTNESASINLTSRSNPSTDTRTSMSPTMIVVVGVVAGLVAICILLLGICLFRRRNRRHKVHQDPEHGFGQYSNLSGQEIASPPKAYHAQSPSDPPALASTRSSASPTLARLGTRSPPISATQTSAGNQLGTKPRRVPVPLLPRLPNSPIPRLPGLPKSPRPERLPTLDEHVPEPQTPAPAMLGPPSGQIDTTTVEPLSGGGLEKLISRMELELKDDPDLK